MSFPTIPGGGFKEQAYPEALALPFATRKRAPVAIAPLALSCDEQPMEWAGWKPGQGRPSHRQVSGAILHFLVGSLKKVKQKQVKLFLMMHFMKPNIAKILSFRQAISIKND